MSNDGDLFIKQAIIATLCDHPDAAKYRERAFSTNNLDKLIEAMSEHSLKLTKADLFVPDEMGRFMIDSEGAWKNFERIVKLIETNNGEKFTPEDFTKPFVKDVKRSLLDSAAAYGGLKKVFSAEVWKDRFEEMQQLWYAMPLQQRKKMENGWMIPDALKKQIYSDAGKEMPEERLAKAGLALTSIRTCLINEAEFNRVCKILHDKGDYFRKEYAMMPDWMGDTVFDRSGAWERFPAIVQEMKSHGERFEVSDFTRKLGEVQSVLGRAAENNALAKVFAPEHWVDRLSDMLELWSHVKPGWKMTARAFDEAYTEAESLTYSNGFKASMVTGKDDLLKPLNDTSHGEKPVLALGIKAVWDNFDAVQQALKNHPGRKIKTSDLRNVSGSLGHSCIMAAAKFGHFDKVIVMMKEGGDLLTSEDLMAKDRHGNTLLNVLSETKQLAEVFTPEMWTGRVIEMRLLWSQVKPEFRKQVNFTQMEVATRQATLKQQSKGGIKIQPKKKQA